MEEPNSALPSMLASTIEGPRLGDPENNGSHVESASGTGTSAWYKGRYPLCRRPPLYIQVDLPRMERDRERQLRDKHLLDKWPRVSGANKIRILHEGIFAATEILNLSFLIH